MGNAMCEWALYRMCFDYFEAVWSECRMCCKAWITIIQIMCRMWFLKSLILVVYDTVSDMLVESQLRRILSNTFLCTAIPIEASCVYVRIYNTSNGFGEKLYIFLDQECRPGIRYAGFWGDEDIVNFDTWSSVTIKKLETLGVLSRVAVCEIDIGKDVYLAVILPEKQDEIVSAMELSARIWGKINLNFLSRMWFRDSHSFFGFLKYWLLHC